MLGSPTPEATTVLLIEKEPHLRRAITECLGGSGYGVIEATDAQEAMTILEHSGEVQVVVADIDIMEPSSGLSFAFEVHHRWPGLGLVITSGRVRHLRPDEVPDEAFFIPRPLPVLMLLELVRTAAHQECDPRGENGSWAAHPTRH